MLKTLQNSDNQNLWQQLVASESEFVRLRMNFLASCPDRVLLIRQALQSPSERGTALRILESLALEERQALFPDLLELASVSHSDIELCRQAILALPKPWLLSKIESTAAEILREGTDEEYRRLLELYLLIDRALTQRLATQALQSDDADIREAGMDFDEHLRGCDFPMAV